MPHVCTHFLSYATAIWPIPLCHCLPGFRLFRGPWHGPGPAEHSTPLWTGRLTAAPRWGGPLGFGGHTGTVSDTPCFLGPRLQPPPAQISKDHHFLELIQSREGTALNPRVRSSRT